MGRRNGKAYMGVKAWKFVVIIREIGCQIYILVHIFKNRLEVL